MTRPWTTLDAVATPEGPLELRQRGERDFLITLAGRVVMTSAAHRSEDALARLACEAVARHAAPRVLVSGLGMGFTLRAALDGLGPGARVHVAELNPAVVAWCRGPLAALTDGAVADARVQVEVADVAAVIARAAAGAGAARFDAIALDMYQGPPARVRPGDPLYGPAAVQQTRAALARGGTFAVWSEGTSAGFEAVLARAGFDVETQRAGHGGRVHVVYLARAREGA